MDVAASSHGLPLAGSGPVQLCPALVPDRIQGGLAANAMGFRYLTGCG
jgi:hypothetical protein